MGGGWGPRRAGPPRRAPAQTRAPAAAGRAAQPYPPASAVAFASPPAARGSPGSEVGGPRPAGPLFSPSPPPGAFGPRPPRGPGVLRGPLAYGPPPPPPQERAAAFMTVVDSGATVIPMPSPTPPYRHQHFPQGRCDEPMALRDRRDGQPIASMKDRRDEKDEARPRYDLTRGRSSGRRTGPPSRHRAGTGEPRRW